MKKDIFISYSSLDKEFATRLSKDLKEKNINVWLDSWDIGYGSNITTEINNGLENSSFLLVILSENSLKSNWVEAEWSSKFGAEVAKGEITVIPTILGDLNENNIPLVLRSKKRVNLSDNYAAELENFVSFILKKRKEALFKDSFDLDKAQNPIQNALLNMVENIGIDLLKKLKGRLSISANRSPEEQLEIIMREIDYAYMNAKREEDKQKSDFEKDPDGSELIMMLIRGRNESVLKEIREKISFISSRCGNKKDAVDAISFEIDCQIVERQSKD